jgi:hypothetical protein
MSQGEIANEENERKNDDKLLPPLDNELEYDSPSDGCNYEPKLLDIDNDLTDDDNHFKFHVDDIEGLNVKKLVELVDDFYDELQLADSNDEAGFNFKTFCTELH